MTCLRTILPPLTHHLGVPVRRVCECPVLESSGLTVPLGVPSIGSDCVFVEWKSSGGSSCTHLPEQLGSGLDMRIYSLDCQHHASNEHITRETILLYNFILHHEM